MIKKEDLLNDVENKPPMRPIDPALFDTVFGGGNTPGTTAPASGSATKAIAPTKTSHTSIGSGATHTADSQTYSDIQYPDSSGGYTDNGGGGFSDTPSFTDSPTFTDSPGYTDSGDYNDSPWFDDAPDYSDFGDPGQWNPS